MSNLNDMLVFAMASPWFAKVTGAVAGAVVSLVYTFPRSRREMVARLVVGVICGVIFGGAVAVRIANSFGLTVTFDKTELMLMGSASASFAAWWTLGLLKCFIKRQAPPSLLHVPSDKNGMNGNV
ncbi:hypothetical protein BRY73_18405 [Ochrobactrum sp. P6BS-III]|uniref:DUF6107 family protein n=1 Tax=unclassified Ochrobactrum TaxID=239106 RepID=UPI0009947779|nr:integral membrane sensor domain MASE1 [Ochrobactrum sp. P6BSIII]OOL15596.1 hypothetical protein BRY73_18405 [Ochrobactrum sp. P6BS-III]